MVKNIFVSLLLTTSCIFASASTFVVTCDSVLERSSHGCGVKLTGKIEQGDSDRLRKILQKPLKPGWFFEKLILDSPGGDVKEAINLASIVREVMLETTTSRAAESLNNEPRASGQSGNWSCVSACFLVWVAGTERFSMQGKFSGIGLHRPFFSKDTYKNNPAQIADAQQTVTIAVRDYLRREEIPERFVEKMIERSSREIYWLNESGDEFALNGRAAWFEEMMISRCGFDPVYNKEMDKYIAQMMINGMSLPQIKNDPNAKVYFDWRRTYNSCMYNIRIESQNNFRLFSDVLPSK